MPTECSAESFDFGTVEGRCVEAAFDVRLIPLTQVRLYVVGGARGAGRRFCEDCLA
jgi:hypothetical protein